MECETFPNRKKEELKIFEWSHNEGINLTGYIFMDVKLVISWSVREFQIESRQSSKSLNSLIMKVSI